MDLELAGKTALVTGSTAGIGYAIARGLTVEGTRVIVNGRTDKRVERARRQIEADLPQSVLSGQGFPPGRHRGRDTGT